ncbi:MAG: glycosyltransferase family 2 protein [Bacteroidetes bacterium]|nr:glycosyltransferase family 2 protein [Bacteroidota bacterium]
MEIWLWIFIALIFYTYVGYGILIYLLVLLKRMVRLKTKVAKKEEYEPEVTFLIPAYNEQDFIHQKIKNTLEQDYPKNKIQIICVTDGSDDKTVELLENFSEVRVLHQETRGGKVAAMNRGMKEVKTPIVIFSDTNTLLSFQAIREIINKFSNPNVGCVAGEKRILNKEYDSASTAGEGIYWKYESFLKKLDSELTSVVGAAGELFAVRTHLYEQMETDIILDDFMLSLRIAMKGYQVAYCPEAYALESASASVKEEMKRKVRISAGGIQSIIRLLPLLNIFKFGMLSFQYISHRVLRWTITPISLLLVLILNVLIVFTNSSQANEKLYLALLIMQLLFYSMALTGWIIENKKIRLKVFFVPYYIVIMNLATYLGFYRIIRGKQSAIWERAKRM